MAAHGVVSLHFFPLAWIFRVLEYYVTGTIGLIVAIVGVMTAGNTSATAILSSAMSIVMWLSAIWILARADKIAARAVQ